jgi:hypothetical protein
MHICLAHLIAQLMLLVYFNTFLVVVHHSVTIFSVCSVVPKLWGQLTLESCNSRILQNEVVHQQFSSCHCSLRELFR